MTATCPVCREYEGGPRQVQAHISGCTDEAHRGSTGSNYREQVWAEHRLGDSEGSEGESREEQEADESGEIETETDGSGSETGDEGPPLIPIQLLVIGAVVVTVIVVFSVVTVEPSNQRDDQLDEDRRRADGRLG